MPNFVEPDLELAKQQRYAIVVARYNKTVTERLLDGALQKFTELGVQDSLIDVVRVPGAWELPVIAARMARVRPYGAIICLGAVIKGETTHDEYINHQVAQSLGEIACQTLKPVLFGVLTCQNLEQALQRAGGSHGNKGAECAEAAIEMVGIAIRQPTVWTDVQNGINDVLSQIGLKK